MDTNYFFILFIKEDGLDLSFNMDAIIMKSPYNKTIPSNTI